LFLTRVCKVFIFLLRHVDPILYLVTLRRSVQNNIQRGAPRGAPPLWPSQCEDSTEKKCEDSTEKHVRERNNTHTHHTEGKEKKEKKGKKKTSLRHPLCT